METLCLWLHHLLSFYLSVATSIFQYILSLLPKTKRLPSPTFVALLESALSLYFRCCDLSPCIVDLDDQTTMHFWTTNHRRFDKPNLVLIHGYGGNSTWQFFRQVGPLSRRFNLYMPDLLFFGKSYTSRSDRSEDFQARCVYAGLRRLGVERFSIYTISYGGFVGYRMAEIYGETVEKVVIVSSGIRCTEEQKREQLRKIGRSPVELLLPEKPQDLRLLLNLAMHKYDPFKWIPDFFIRYFIKAMCDEHRKEKQELVEHLMAKNADLDIPIIPQETLLIWGDKDNIFPLYMAYQLQRHLGPKSKLEIIRDTGHAANMESPDSLNELIIPFVLGSSN